jgi:hypothetical protein
VERRRGRVQPGRRPRDGGRTGGVRESSS